jgi:hypothetical protein
MGYWMVLLMTRNSRHGSLTHRWRSWPHPSWEAGHAGPRSLKLRAQPLQARDQLQCRCCLRESKPFGVSEAQGAPNGLPRRRSVKRFGTPRSGVIHGALPGSAASLATRPAPRRASSRVKGLTRAVRPAGPGQATRPTTRRSGQRAACPRSAARIGRAAPTR